MRMQEHLDLCRRRARIIKADYPDRTYMQRLEIAAHEQHFRNYKTLEGLHKLLGPDGVPSHLAITMAGGRDTDSPYQLVTKSVSMPWKEAGRGR